MDKELQELTIILTNPRGFCAGVHRAIQIVEKTIEKYGSPVYVRHEIVHNQFVVERLEAKGAIFVDSLSEVPNGKPVIFSAHGVPRSVIQRAEDRNLTYFDATCPLVSKVHQEAKKHHTNALQVILIGHDLHPEVIGTMGQIPEGTIILVENEEQAKEIQPNTPGKLAYITQTTLSINQTASIIEILKERFPNIIGPNKNDICYATTNRQTAIKEIAPLCDAIMIIGAPNSSNSKRLVEVAKDAGCNKSFLVQRASEIEWEELHGIKTLGISAGASAPEILVKEAIESATKHFKLNIIEKTYAEENIMFKLPKELE
ncbi:MAG: 4-hydroxy-3-methylbut-2-enyl diphosphate reductase [Alphaproteobacteria bacterium]|nr:4-hydroxy-3-methylbut-2-enyl diphosphate reductase [Alphaproteobacteria bacterium]